MQQQKMHRCPTGLLDPHDLEDCSSCQALLEIFLRLPLPERRKLPLVCKKWRRVALGSPELWRRVQVGAAGVAGQTGGVQSCCTHTGATAAKSCRF